MKDVIISIVGVLIGIVLLVIPFIRDRCPDCKGKLVDTDYDTNIDKVVWTCKRCGKKWILY